MECFKIVLFWMVTIVTMLKCVFSQSGSGDNWLEQRPAEEWDTAWKQYTEWNIGIWSQCSTTCGESYRSRRVQCVRNDIIMTNLVVEDYNNISLVVIDDVYCDDKPKDQELCKTSACPPEWVTEEWSQCVPKCGTGHKTRRVKCRRRRGQKRRTVFCQSHTGVVLTPEHCSALRTPITFQECETPCGPSESDTRPAKERDTTWKQYTEWNIGIWSQCSTTCGESYRSRSVQCVLNDITMTNLDVEDYNNISLVVIEDIYCDDKPKYQELCKTSACPPEWVTEEWSQCVPKCGSGHQTRRVTCKSIDGRRLLPSLCDKNTRPTSVMGCNSGRCQLPKWITGPWSECNARCGRGQKRRTVSCQSLTGDVLTPEHCSTSRTPIRFQECETPCGPPETDTTCRDSHSVQYCPFVLKFRFCNNHHFRKMCCQTCSAAQSSIEDGGSGAQNIL